jgi:hypothetical protein
MNPQGPPGGMPPPGMGYPPPGPMAPQGLGPGGAPPGVYQAPRPAAKKKGCGPAAIILVVLGVFVALGVGGLVFYFFGVGGTKVKSVAHEHLPEDCDLALRVDLKELMTVGPVKEHVVAAIEDVAKEDGGGRLAAFLLAARMDPKKDLSEVAACVNGLGGAKPDYGVVIGGKLLDDNGVITAMDRHDGADEFEDPRKVGKLVVLEEREDHVLVSQATSDSAWLFASDEELLESVAKKGDAHEDYDFPLEEHISGVLTAASVKKLLADSGIPGVDKIKKAGRVVLSLSLDPGELGVRAEFPDDASASAAADELKSLLGMMAMVPVGPASSPGMKEAIRGAKVSTKGKELLVTMPISEKSIEETCEDMADEIRERDK